MAFVRVSQGFLKGGKAKTESGFEYLEFLSIPYAKPPVGDLRFKSPQPPESWDDERDATKSDRINTAYQVNVLLGADQHGSEDCLYLNVYTPQLPRRKSTPLPVIVYIHGGGFINGNGIMKNEYGPDFLVEQNTVVVMINYRLGVFGFLSLDIPEAAGNMGLKDQVMALEWVRDNIEKFGGDKDNVTIMGTSAGSASVEYQILSPKSKGLFHKAILQSGSTLNHWAINFHPVKLTRELVKILDYQGSLDDTKAVHEFLLKIPASNLLIAATQVLPTSNTAKLNFGFVPTVEKDYGNGDAFLTSSPYKLLKEGIFNLVPVIRGFCNREGALTGVMNPNTKTNIIETKKFVDPYVQAMGANSIESNEKDQYNSKFTSAYLENTQSDIDKIVEDFFGDIDFASGVWVAGKLSSLHVPVYMYQFEYAGKLLTLKKLLGLSPDEPGAIHGDDFIYVINQDMIHGNIDEDDLLTRKRLVTLFTNFAKFGKPILSTSDMIPVNWPQFTEKSQDYLVINKDLHLKSNYEPQKMEIFQEIYEKYSG